MLSHDSAFPVKREDQFFRCRGRGRETGVVGRSRDDGGQDEGGTSHVHGEHPRRAEGAGGRSQTEDSRRHTEPDLIAPRRRRPGPADVTGAARWRPRYVRPRSPLPGAAAPPPRLRERRQRPRRGRQRRPLHSAPRTQPGTACGTGTRRRGPYARSCREQCWPEET